MASRTIIGGALRPSTLAAIASIAIALAIGSAPVAILIALNERLAVLQ